MEKRFTFVKGKRPYYFALDLIKQKTNLKEDDAILIFDLLVFYIRKHLLLYRNLKFLNFGKLQLMLFKRGGVTVRYHPAWCIRQILNNKRQHTFEKSRFQNFRDPWDSTSFLTEIIGAISKNLLIERSKVCFLINVFFYSLVDELLKNKVVKIRFFAYFYFAKYKFNRARFSRTEVIRMNPIKNFKDEINNKTTEFRVTDRLKRIFSKLHVTNEIKVEEFL